MRALQVVARGKAEFVEAEKPTLQPGQALVRPKLVGLCGSDIWMMDFGPEELFPRAVGTTGHEVVAEIIEMNGTHPSLRTGDMTLALAPDHRGMAEYYVAEIPNLLPLPTGKSYEEYLMAQQLGTVIYACRYVPSMIGKTVAIIGQGSAGLWFNVTAKRLGARRVIAFDHHEHRRELSKFYGADHVLDGADESAEDQLLSLNDGQHADIVIEAAGRESAINLAFRLTRDYDGFMLQFGLPREPLHVDYGTMFWRRLSLKSMVHAAREPQHTSTLHALDLINNEIDVSKVITHRLGFKDVHQAFDLQRTAADGAVKMVIEMP